MNSYGRLALVGVATLALSALTVVSPPPAQAVPGLQLVSASSGHNSLAGKQVQALCPAGLQVVGAAASVQDGQGEVILTGYRPVAGRAFHYVEAAAHEDDTGYASNWSITAYALCSPPIPGWELNHVTGATGSGSNGGAIALCGTGKLPLGLGGWVTNAGAGQVILNDVYLTSNDGVGARAVENEGGYEGLWNVTAYAICSPPIPGHQAVYQSKPASGWNSVNPKSLVLACPPGTQVHGVGARISGSTQDTTFSDLMPAANLTSVTFTAREDEDGEPDGWQLQAILVCGI
jgi:hypothetical protein